jgi:protein PhnA
MSLQTTLTSRSNNQCELCSSTNTLSLYEVAFAPYKDENGCMMICAKCLAQIEKQEELDAAHWNCLTASMWSEVPAVQVTAWRMLNRLRAESWAADNLDMLYLDDEKLAWAKATGDDENDGQQDVTQCIMQKSARPVVNDLRLGHVRRHRFLRFRHIVAELLD